MLHVDQVSLNFGGIVALSEVSFEVPDGARFGLIGPNGAGKTAMLNCICGVYRPQEGDIRLDDRNLLTLRKEQISRLGIARTFQSMDHFREFRVLDYVMLGRIQHLSASAALSAVWWPSVVRQEKVQRKLAEGALERCGLAMYANARLSEIPYGTQKLVDVARVLSSEAAWALLDEPTSGTTSDDRPAISQALDVLAEQGTATIVVDHDVDFVARHVDTIVALDQGKVIAQGPTVEVLDDPVVRRIYRGLVREGQVDTAEHLHANDETTLEATSISAPGG